MNHCAILALHPHPTAGPLHRPVRLLRGRPVPCGERAQACGHGRSEPAGAAARARRQAVPDALGPGGLPGGVLARGQGGWGCRRRAGVAGF